MTEQEAINIVKNEKKCVIRNIKGCDRDCANCDLIMKDEDILQGYDTAIEALEKQIAKKMTIGSDNGKPRKCCGNCGCFVLPASKYCSKCGQKLDWS